MTTYYSLPVYWLELYKSRQKYEYDNGERDEAGDEYVPSFLVEDVCEGGYMAIECFN